jgi:hypothetical protein
MTKVPIWLLFLVAIVSPYLPSVIPWISYAGLIILCVYLTSFILYKKPRSFSRVPAFGLLASVDLKNLDSNLSSHLEIQEADKVAKVVMNLLVSKSIKIEHLNVIYPSILQHSSRFLSWFRFQKRQMHLEQKLWINIHSVILKYIKQYKRIRKEVLKGNLPNSKLPMMKSASLDSLHLEAEDSLHHLDDFNEELPEWIDESSPDMNSPRHNMDELNHRIVQKFGFYSILHPAVINVEQQKAYIRMIVDQCLNSSKIMKTIADSSVSRLVKMYCREMITGQFIWPFIEKWTHPDHLNQFVLEKTSRRLITQKSVRGFKTLLDTYFTQFPPRFLQKRADERSTNFSLGQKYRYFEGLSKFSKKCNSITDLIAIRANILYEIRKRLEDASISLRFAKFCSGFANQKGRYSNDGHIKALSQIVGWRSSKI